MTVQDPLLWAVYAAKALLFVTCFSAGMQLMLQQSGGGAPHSF